MPDRRTVLAAMGTLPLAGCLGGDGSDDGDGPTPEPFARTITVQSSAFVAGETIPRQYTGGGADDSPPLSIAGVPADAASLALVVDDPDAPNPPFTHWLCWAIPADTTEVPAGIPQEERVPSLGDAAQGTNDFGKLGYRGPLPPEGDGPHRYRFTVSALEEPLALEPGADRAAVADALAGNVFEQGRLVGRYER